MVNDMQKYRRFGDDRVIKRRIAGETLLVPYHARLADMSKLYFLDEVSEFIWDRLEGPADMAELVASVVDAFEVDPDTAQTDVERFVGEVLAAGLCEVTD